MDINSNTTCRTCLHKTDSEVSIDDTLDPHTSRYREMIACCTNVDVSVVSEYPNKLCQSCVFQLPTVWKFVTMCRESEISLQKHFKERKPVWESSDSALMDIKVEIKEEYAPSYMKSDGSIDSLESEGEETEYKVEIEEVVNSLAHADDRLTRKKIKSKKRKSSKGFKENLKCPSCDHIAETACRLKKHIRLNHKDLQLSYSCSVCGRVFKRKSDLVVHTRTHSGEKPFLCNYCPMRFAQSGTLVEHRRNHTGESPYACPHCSRVFSSRSSFWRHKRVHTKEKPYSCELCGKSFAHSSTLKHHAFVHSDLRPHTCRVCHKTTKSPYALRQHMLVHSDKDFICEQCGKKFSVKANLENHIKKMHGEGAGQCTLCGRETSDLKEHMHTHTGDCPHECEVCGRRFGQRSSLAGHAVLHANAGKFKCPEDNCRETFPKRNMLDFHTRKIHSNETSHICPHCSKGFFRMSDLSRHVNTIHNDRSS